MEHDLAILSRNGLKTDINWMLINQMEKIRSPRATEPKASVGVQAGEDA